MKALHKDGRNILAVMAHRRGGRFLAHQDGTDLLGSSLLYRGTAGT